MAVPRYIAPFPGVGQPAHMIGCFPKRYPKPALNKAQCARQAEQPAADNAKMFARFHSSLIFSQEQTCSRSRMLSVRYCHSGLNSLGNSLAVDFEFPAAFHTANLDWLIARLL